MTLSRTSARASPTSDCHAVARLTFDKRYPRHLGVSEDHRADGHRQCHPMHPSPLRSRAVRSLADLALTSDLELVTHVLFSDLVSVHFMLRPYSSRPISDYGLSFDLSVRFVKTPELWPPRTADSHDPVSNGVSCIFLYILSRL